MANKAICVHNDERELFIVYNVYCAFETWNPQSEKRALGLPDGWHAAEDLV